MKGKKLVLPLLIGFAVALGLPSLAPAAFSSPVPASTFTTSTSFPINIFTFVPCASGGTGEVVELSGQLHDLFHVTFDAAGGFHLSVLDNPQGVSGTGLTTGDKYQGTGVTRFNLNGRVGAEQTYVNNFRIIGQGSGNNFLVHENFHITVNPNGTVTSVHDNFSIECK